MVYLTLFGFSLLAATLLPGGSEALLLYDLSLGYNPLLLIFTATIGNTIGSVINYVIGLKGTDYIISRGYAKEEKLQKAENFYQEYGVWSLLLSWMPIIGDPITFIAGVLHFDFKKFVLIVLFAKGVRYLVIAQLV